MYIKLPTILKYTMYWGEWFWIRVCAEYEWILYKGSNLVIERSRSDL